MSDANEYEKTQVKPTSPSNNQAADDKTRFAPPKNTEADDNKTRVQSPRQPVIDQASDKTRFVPQRKQANAASNIQRGNADEKTRINAANSPLGKIGDASLASGALDKSSILKGRFILEELLGAGGMGVVYKAKDLLKIEAQDRDPYVAIKVLIDEFKAHPEAFMALQRESRKTQRIAHPNIVTVYDFDRDGDTVFMTMEYLDGKPLDKLISQHRGVGLVQEEAIKILEGICAALVYAHGQNIIHSDFKPGNIFVNNKGIAKVIDFGIARAVAKVEHREESIDDRTVFDAGNLGALTPAYASLEMLEGKNPDVRDDIYALGCIAYELFTGDHPFNRVHADEAKRQKLKPKRIQGMKKRQWRAIERALAFERENRTQSVELFWAEFNSADSQAWKYFTLALLLLAGAAGFYYQYKPEVAPVLSEDQVRSEIEQKLRLEMKKKALTDLYEQASFSPEWEAQVWTEVQELRELVGQSDDWLTKKETAFFNLYIQKITTAVGEDDLQNAQVWHANAGRYGNDRALLDALAEKILAALEERKRKELEQQQQQEQHALEQEALAKEKQQQLQVAQAQAKQHSDFETALSNVNKQLACNSTIDMRDFEIAVTKLRTLNMVRYSKEEPAIVNGLAQCIRKIGATFPERAEVIKRQAIRVFNGNSVLEKITIAAKDPCGASLAGFGARGMGSSCRDKLTGATKSPAMVVIPGKEGLKTFALGKFEVSVDEMNEFCKQSGQCKAIGASEAYLPVTNISAATINAYLKWLSDKSGRTYRLPTIQEWQYAAKATNNTPDPNRNCKLNSRGIQKGSALNKATLGAQNSWGVVNHLGNARELVAQRGGGYLAVGGSYDTEMQECQYGNQEPHTGAADQVTGFRVLREIQ